MTNSLYKSSQDFWTTIYWSIECIDIAQDSTGDGVMLQINLFCVFDRICDGENPLSLQVSLSTKLHLHSLQK